MANSTFQMVAFDENGQVVARGEDIVSVDKALQLASDCSAHVVGVFDSQTKFARLISVRGAVTLQIQAAWQELWCNYVPSSPKEIVVVAAVPAPEEVVSVAEVIAVPVVEDEEIVITVVEPEKKPAVVDNQPTKRRRRP